MNMLSEVVLVTIGNVISPQLEHSGHKQQTSTINPDRCCSLSGTGKTKLRQPMRGEFRHPLLRAHAHFKSRQEGPVDEPLYWQSCHMKRALILAVHGSVSANGSSSSAWNLASQCRSCAEQTQQVDNIQIKSLVRAKDELVSQSMGPPG